jgi:hypothetical protein
MATAGRILLIPRGKYNKETQYQMLDMVSYARKGWVCKKTCKGIEPKEGEYWSECIDVSGEVDEMLADVVNLKNNIGNIMTSGTILDNRILTDDIKMKTMFVITSAYMPKDYPFGSETEAFVVYLADNGANRQKVYVMQYQGAKVYERSIFNGQYVTKWEYANEHPTLAIIDDNGIGTRLKLENNDLKIYSVEEEEVAVNVNGTTTTKTVASETELWSASNHEHPTLANLDSGNGTRVKVENNDLKVYSVEEIKETVNVNGTTTTTIVASETELWSASNHSHQDIEKLNTEGIGTRVKVEGADLKIYSVEKINETVNVNGSMTTVPKIEEFESWSALAHNHNKLVSSANGNSAVMQDDGNFVIYDGNNTPKWTSSSPLTWQSVQNVETGWAGIYPSGVNVVTSCDVEFTRTFTTPPHVVITPQTSNPSKCFVSVDNITTTGFRVHLCRTDAVETTHMHWIAMV